MSNYWSGPVVGRDDLQLYLNSSFEQKNNNNNGDFGRSSVHTRPNWALPRVPSHQSRTCLFVLWTLCQLAREIADGLPADAAFHGSLVFASSSTPNLDLYYFLLARPFVCRARGDGSANDIMNIISTHCAVVCTLRSALQITFVLRLGRAACFTIENHPIDADVET